MESVRNHLQNMLKTSRDLNIDGDYGPSVLTGTAEDDVPGDGAANHSMSSVDTAAFLQKLLPNSSPLEELKVSNLVLQVFFTENVRPFLILVPDKLMTSRASIYIYIHIFMRKTACDLE